MYRGKKEGGQLYVETFINVINGEVDMSKKYDVIVVGAGPAGLIAAKVVGENGFDVALLEKKTEPEVLARACGATLDSANEYLHHDLFICNLRNKRLCFPAHGFSVKYDGDYRDSYACYFYSPSGNIMQAGVVEEQKKKGVYGKITSVVDKEILISSMLEEAKNYSVDVFPGVNVDKVTIEADGVKVEGSGQSFEGRYIVAADGINSQVAKITGLNEERTYLCQMRCVSYYVTGMELPEPDACAILYGYMKDGPSQAFIFPRPNIDEYNFIVITIHPKVDLAEATDYFMKDAFCASWFKNAKISNTLSANENCYTPIVEAYKNRVFISGDVGATQELEISGAIISGWKAGQAASVALQEENLGLEITATTKYIEWWKDAYVDYYSWDAYMKTWSLPYALGEPEVIDYLFGLLEPIPACFNPYTSRKHVGKAIRKVMPIIEKDKPEVLQKLGNMGIPFAEAIADITRMSKPI
jgi:digeranylgeranylglycerophospholipid reductase